MVLPNHTCKIVQLAVRASEKVQGENLGECRNNILNLKTNFVVTAIWTILHVWFGSTITTIFNVAHVNNFLFSDNVTERLWLTSTKTSFCRDGDSHVWLESCNKQFLLHGFSDILVGQFVYIASTWQDDEILPSVRRIVCLLFSLWFTNRPVTFPWRSCQSE